MERLADGDPDCEEDRGYGDRAEELQRRRHAR
jgi:hypothetical protein